ncbi:MAG: hypothetical protein GF418_07720 [Chitinivibrionales bacterium]|nr:hypothetical protein [Chitinivibrionales bacterium]MBD3395501.1 hypothetical protein [Chitinivibrionales bacterium]
MAGIFCHDDGYHAGERNAAGKVAFSWAFSRRAARFSLGPLAYWGRYTAARDGDAVSLGYGGGGLIMDGRLVFGAGPAHPAVGIIGFSALEAGSYVRDANVGWFNGLDIMVEHERVAMAARAAAYGGMAVELSEAVAVEARAAFFMLPSAWEISVLARYDVVGIWVSVRGRYRRCFIDDGPGIGCGMAWRIRVQEE